MAGSQSFIRKLWQSIGSIKTGVVLLILVVIVSAAGTVILQRPITDPDEMQRAYSSQTLHILDSLGLTNVFHAWWFVALLILVSISIVSASIQRFPNSWRYFARPYKSPTETFCKSVTPHAQIPIPNEEAGLAVAERVMQKEGLHPERIVRENSFSLFGERHRLSELAVYIVHASLLLIFAGGIIDAVWGWSGFAMIPQGDQAAQVEARNGTIHKFGFIVRCDGTGQENYADGTPKRWWSKLSVLENGQLALQKEIVVNDPLVYRGIRFYQSGYGMTGKVASIKFDVMPTNKLGQTREISVGPDQPFPLDADTTVRIAEFIPDYTVGDGQVYTRSNEVENPAVHLIVESRGAGKNIDVWLPPIPGFEHNAEAAYQFTPKDLQMAHYTGLQVSHEPGQWGVWAGVVLMGIGLFVVFYMVHVRFWAVPMHRPDGQLVLWVGAVANKNKDVFEQRFRKMVSEIETQVNFKPEPAASARVSSLVGE
jgi:cytochrome c biogenesis protein